MNDNPPAASVAPADRADPKGPGKRIHVTVRDTLGVMVAHYTGPAGSITVRVPADLVAGDAFAGSMALRPAGAGSARGRNLKALQRLHLKFGNGRIPIREGFFTGRLPENVPSFFYLQLEGGGGPGAWATIPCIRGVLRPVAPEVGTQTYLLIPWGCQAGEPIAIGGSFNAAPDEWTVKIGARRAQILAISPRTLLVQCPAGLTGPQPVSISHGALALTGEIRCLGVVAEVRKAPGKGNAGTLKVEVRGGEVTPADLRLEVVFGRSVRAASSEFDGVISVPHSYKGRVYRTSVPVLLDAGVRAQVSCLIALSVFAALSYSYCWTCSGCADESKANNAACTVGATKDDPPVEDYGPIQFGNTQWMRYKTRHLECVEVVCKNGLFQECCRYTLWKETVGSLWKKSVANDPTTGKPIWVDDPPGLPCRCGSLLEIALNMGFSDFDKYGYYKQIRETMGCPGLSWEGAADLAKNCGFGSFWSDATSLSGKDWFEVFQKVLQMVGGLGGATTPNPLGPPGPPGVLIGPPVPIK